MKDLTNFIKKVLLAFEQGRTNIKYDEIYKYEDGPNEVKQITLSFGITEYGNLKNFIKDYSLKGGRYSKDFNTYIPLIGTKPLVQDTSFINLLKESASDPVMQQCQEQAFDSMYITPALTWCSKNNLILPLSRAVIADSFLQSGSILSFIRNKFAAKLPVSGGDEKEWVESYCKARKDWLTNHSRKILNNTVYRMNFFLPLIESGDWNLEQKNYIANGVKIVAN